VDTRTIRPSQKLVVPEPAAKAPVDAPAIKAARPFSSLVQVDVSARSHPGRVRDRNEDHFFIGRIGRSLDTLLTNLPDGSVPLRAEEVGYTLIVADGMGGHAAGEIASSMAISTLVSLSLDAPAWIMRIDETVLPELASRIRQRVHDVNALLIEHSKKYETLRGMGTTLTAFRSIGRDALVFHVGDSRAYLLRAGHLHRLTRDHTYAQLLVDTGAMPEDAEDLDRLRHILTNAVGGRSEDVHLDVDMVRLCDGDRVLLCSDGLTDLVEDELMAGVMGTGPASEVCERLVDLALDRGGRDNITAIVGVYTLPQC
jgi:PPM family protein phosphatase